MQLRTAILSASLQRMGMSRSPVPEVEGWGEMIAPANLLEEANWLSIRDKLTLCGSCQGKLRRGWKKIGQSLAVVQEIIIP